MKTTILICLILCICTACNNTKEHNENSDNDRNIEFFEIDRFYGHHDSTYSPEDLLMKRKLMYLEIFCTEIKNNQRYLTVGKDYFKEHGIPVEYYDQLIKRFRRDEKTTEEVYREEFRIKFNPEEGIEKQREIYSKFLKENEETGIFWEDFFQREILKGQKGEPNVFDE